MSCSIGHRPATAFITVSYSPHWSGYFVCTAEWFREYVYEVQILEEMVPPQVAQIFQSPDVSKLDKRRIAFHAVRKYTCILTKIDMSYHRLWRSSSTPDWIPATMTGWLRMASHTCDLIEVCSQGHGISIVKVVICTSLTLISC